MTKSKQRNEREIESAVLSWAASRCLLDSSDPIPQFVKLAEEFGELSEALQKKDQELIKDAIGDMGVVLIILAYRTGFNLFDCISHAYDVISFRNGKIIDGIFVKEN